MNRLFIQQQNPGTWELVLNKLYHKASCQWLQYIGNGRKIHPDKKICGKM